MIHPKFPQNIHINVDQQADWNQLMEFFEYISNSPICYNFTCGHRGSMCSVKDAQNALLVLQEKSYE